MNIVQLVVNRNPPFTKWVKKMSGFFGLAILAGLFCGMLCLTPLGLYLEEELGLAWLFSMRGQVPPPSQVVIISVDQMSAETLHLPDDPEKWPRDYYARLIDQINRQEPALIALNMVFNENRELQSDRKLAEAIKAKRNVILGNYLKHKIIPMSGNVEAVSYESLIESIDIINAAALASAPFLVPKTSSTVKQFWTNKDSAGDLSTFPDVVFQCYVLKQAYPEIMALLKQVDPKLAATFPGRFDEFSNDHAILEKIGGLLATFIRFNGNTEKLSTLLAANPFPLPTKQLLDAWLGLLDNHKSLYLNHYGNVGAIETIPFFQALEHLTPDILRNKIVMVGFSETIEPEKNLGFYSVFSNANGQTVSPIEIAATAVANLLDNTWLKPLDASRQFWLLLVWGCLLSGLCSLLAYRWAIALMMVLSAIYAYVAFYVFVHQQFWLPLVIPLGLQMPLLLIAASVLQFRKTHQAKYKMQLVLGHLLPKEIVDKIPHQPENLAMDTGGKMLQGICMATDVSDYTKLSESLEPDQLIDCMNAYYAAIFPLVNDNGGYVTDLAGDGMYAVWLNSEQLKHVRIKACAAALQIRESICQFNVTRQPQLITRFGLVCGDISIITDFILV